MVEGTESLEFPELDASAVSELAPERLFRLDGKVALVTGAGGGIGAWLAAALGVAGARIALADRDEESTTAVRDVLEQVGVRTVQLAGDLADDGVPLELVASTVEHLGRLDVLVNGAAVNRRLPILEVDEETFDRIARIDLRAPYFLSRAAARVMIDQGGGSIVHIGSMSNAIGLEGVSVYGASKAGLSQLAKVMSVEWSGFGVRVNCIAPGFMLTPLSRPLWLEEATRRWIVDRVPVRRPGYASELVGPLLLLASDAGSFMTGHTIYVDGGFLAGSRWTDDPGFTVPE